MCGRFPSGRWKNALLPVFRGAGSEDFDASVRPLQRTLSDVQAELADLRRAHGALVVKEWTESRAPLLEGIDARLSLVSFEGCDFTGADFRGACLTGCTIRGSTLNGVVGVGSLRGVTMPWTDLVGSVGALAAALGIATDEE